MEKTDNRWKFFSDRGKINNFEMVILAVLLHPMLPNHISNVFACTLQEKSFKYLQPKICEQIEDLLGQVEN